MLSGLSAIAAFGFVIWGVHQKGSFLCLTAPSKHRSPNRSSCAISLRFGCGHKRAGVFHGRQTKAILGRVGLAIPKSRRLEVRCYLNLRPKALNSVPAWESLAISVRTGAAVDIAIHITSDLRLWLEGHSLDDLMFEPVPSGQMP